MAILSAVQRVPGRREQCGNPGLQYRHEPGLKPAIPAEPDIIARTWMGHTMTLLVQTSQASTASVREARFDAMG